MPALIDQPTMRRENPVFDASEISSGSPYFQEPLTLVIGLVRDDDSIEFRVDGRRFEPVADRDAT